VDKDGDDVKAVVDANDAMPLVATGYKLVDVMPRPVVLVPNKMVATLEPMCTLEFQDHDTAATVTRVGALEFQDLDRVANCEGVGGSVMTMAPLILEWNRHA